MASRPKTKTASKKARAKKSVTPAKVAHKTPTKGTVSDKAAAKRTVTTQAPAKKTPATPKRAQQVAPSKRSAPRLQTPSMFQKVAFTMFSVTDPTRARAFYEDTLGFKRGLASPDGVWTEYDLPLGGCLALFCHPNPAFRGTPGGASIAFEVSDLDALNARLSAAGVDYQGPMIHGPRCRMSNIKDSEGNGIILHQLNAH